MMCAWAASARIAPAPTAAASISLSAGDQLLKGAALNAVQIAEVLIQGKK
jgi:aspartate-semialdehyde dehydrogenase